MDITTIAKKYVQAFDACDIATKFINAVNEKNKGVVQIKGSPPRIPREYLYTYEAFYVLYLCCIIGNYRIQYRVMPKSVYEDNNLMVIFHLPGYGDGNLLYFFPLGLSITMEYYK